MILLAINPEIILLAAVVFTVVILFLVFMLQFAASKLVQQGDVKIEINGEKTVSTSAGDTLLTVLSNQKLFLPSACGGGGTCAMCKCQITEGGGEILPTETGHVTRAEQRENVRLACQVKV